jgi:hypothetical protein
LVPKEVNESHTSSFDFEEFSSNISIVFLKNRLPLFHPLGTLSSRATTQSTKEKCEATLEFLSEMSR